MRWDLPKGHRKVNLPAHGIAVRFCLIKLEKFILLKTVLKSSNKSEKCILYIFTEILTNNPRINYVFLNILTLKCVGSY